MTGPGAELESIIYFLDSLLGTEEFPDYDNALNGLQVSAEGPVRRVGAAVDASVETIRAAVEAGADLLIVHHGIYWDGLRPLTSRLYQRVGPLIRANAALYSAHLPLDAHPDVGNNAGLIRALGLPATGTFARFADAEIGLLAEADEPRGDLRERVADVLDGPVRLIEGGPEQVQRVGVVTGGGGGFVREAAEKGLDTLLTGEGSHHTYVDAMELGVNVLLAGHYATETFGVKALAESVEERFGVPWQFFDFPSGL